MPRRACRLAVLCCLAGAVTIITPASRSWASSVSPRQAGQPWPSNCTRQITSLADKTVSALNSSTERAAGHLTDLITARHLKPGDAAVIDGSGPDGSLSRESLSRSADGDSYMYEMDLAASGPNPSYAMYQTGTYTVFPSDHGRTTAVSLTFDYDTLNSVDANSLWTGRVQASYQDITNSTLPKPGSERKLVVNFTNFATNIEDLSDQRSGSYTYLEESGIGGKYVYGDSHLMSCFPNPNGASSTATALKRWYIAPDHTVHTRWDGEALGGALPNNDVWMETSCRAGLKTGFILAKLEDSQGNTAQFAQTANSGCDPVWHAVPSPTDSATDFAFGSPISFPGER